MKKFTRLSPLSVSCCSTWLGWWQGLFRIVGSHSLHKALCAWVKCILNLVLVSELKYLSSHITYLYLLPSISIATGTDMTPRFLCDTTRQCWWKIRKSWEKTCVLYATEIFPSHNWQIADILLVWRTLTINFEELTKHFTYRNEIELFSNCL